MTALIVRRVPENGNRHDAPDLICSDPLASTMVGEDRREMRLIDWLLRALSYKDVNPLLVRY